MSDMSSVGKRIRNTRETKRISQNELAELLGVSAAAVCQWETKGTTPRARTLRKVAEALGVSEEYLSSGAQIDEPIQLLDDSIAAHIDRAKAKIAELTGIDVSRISFKITFLS